MAVAPSGQDANRVLVVGANPAGLATAISLHKRGLPVAVFERMPGVVEVRGGLHIWTNGAQALTWLGAIDHVLGAGEPLHTVEFRRSDGRVFACAELEDTIATYGHSPFFTPRVEVARGLAKAAPDGVVHYDSQVVGVEQDADGVIARLADGSEWRGTVLVGADGVNSTVRRELFDAPEPRYAGFQDWGAVVEFDHPAFPPGSLRILWGAGARLGMAHIGQGRVYWAASLKRPETETDPPDIQTMLERFRGWSEPIEELIAATDPDAFYGAPIRELPEMPHWTSGRTVLVGDAAHAMQPNLGRGASEAVEDGIVLASELESAGDLMSRDAVDAAFRRYESRRMKSVYTIVKRSRQMGQLGLWESSVGATARELYLRGIFPIVLRTMKADFKKSLAEFGGSD